MEQSRSVEKIEGEKSEISNIIVQNGLSSDGVPKDF
jgi:hypothetical protein